MFANLPNFRKANPDLWQGRKDTNNKERFFQKVKFIKSENELISSDKKIILIGFASDVGITRNLGRPGAKLGPDQIRTQLAKLPCHNEHEIIDLGNIVCDYENDLETAQKQFAELVGFCHLYGHKTIALGGGHEIALGHFQGLTQHYTKLGIINFDAHFDLRPHQVGEPGTSGTPFSQIARYCEIIQLPFKYCCFGIQHSGNTNTLFERAKELKVKYLSAEEINELSIAKQIAFIDDFMKKLSHIYLSICMDVFAECYAPGVSAPQVLGLAPWQTLPVLKHIIQSNKVMSLDVAELSPPLDQDQKTARLSAQIIAELLNTI